MMHLRRELDKFFTYMLCGALQHTSGTDSVLSDTPIVDSIKTVDEFIFVIWLLFWMPLFTFCKGINLKKYYRNW